MRIAGLKIEGYSDVLAAEVASMLFSVRKVVNEQHPKMKSAGARVIMEAFEIYMNMLEKGGEYYNAKGKIEK